MSVIDVINDMNLPASKKEAEEITGKNKENASTLYYIAGLVAIGLYLYFRKK